MLSLANSETFGVMEIKDLKFVALAGARAVELESDFAVGGGQLDVFDLGDGMERPNSSLFLVHM